MMRVSVLAAALLSSASALKQCNTHSDCLGAGQCFFSFDEHNTARQKGYCVNHNADRETAFIETGTEPKQPTKFAEGGMKVSSLTVQAPAGSKAQVVLLSENGKPYSVGVDATGSFSIGQENQQPAISVSPETGEIVARTKMLAAGALRSATGFYVQDTMQWALWADEEFSKGQQGWKAGTSPSSIADASTTQCKQGIHMLGGFRSLSKESITKTFSALPAHNRIRVVATYHFIDRWEGQMGFMKLGQDDGPLSYRWTERYDVNDYTNLIDVCGGSTGEGHFSSTVDVSSAHEASSLKVVFGSTFDLLGGGSSSGASGFYGISSVQIYLRTV